MLAWGRKVSAAFRDRVVDEVAPALSVDPNWLMTIMAFETGETFSPSVRNAAGSGAVGLIQFMPSTCASLGLTVEEMAALSAEDQLGYVLKYFAPWAGRIRSLGDAYGVVLWPAMVGKPDSWPVFRRDDPNHPARYLQNAGLDFNRDGEITKAEVVARVERELAKGLLPENAWGFGPEQGGPQP